MYHISDVIAHLQDLQARYGDLPCVVNGEHGSDELLWAEQATIGVQDIYHLDQGTLDYLNLGSVHYLHFGGF